MNKNLNICTNPIILVTLRIKIERQYEKYNHQHAITVFELLTSEFRDGLFI